MKSTGFLKVTSILMIIGGAISAVMCVFAIIGVGALVAVGGESGFAALLYLAVALAVASSVLELIAGIKGLGACKEPDKAAACVKWGVIIIVLSIVSIISDVVAGADFSITSLILNLLVPGLYIYGATQMKNGTNA